MLGRFALGVMVTTAAFAEEAPLPFKHKIEVYRDKDGTTLAFVLALEQPFFAEEFEKSNYLRLVPQDRNAFLIYPKETRFRQKHAAFYGRLRGSGTARVQLAYETVLENIDGSRRVDVRTHTIEIPIASETTGPRDIYLEWARRQNEHFLELLSYYPEDTFLQYGLLQSAARHGIAAPKLPAPLRPADALETDLYAVMSGALAIQQALESQALSSAPASPADQDVHISQLTPPSLRSLTYEELLKKQREQPDARPPKVHDVAKLIPEDQYLLQFHSMSAAGEWLDLVRDWGGNLLRLLSASARSNRLQEKYEDQLLLRRDTLTRLFADGVVAELAVTGSDPYFVEGTDVTLILRLRQPELFALAVEGWLKAGREKYPLLTEREFNYRGHKVAARYTEDRVVSSFVVHSGEFAIYANSHAAIRRIIDVITGATPKLADALDYRYVTTLLPPADDADAGYLYASEAFLRRQVSPRQKISEKRRVQCFNNLVMLNNASMLYRLEHSHSPAALSELVEGRFIDPAKLVCPHGGAYAFDADHDAATCSLHNRLKILTPNSELSVLKVSKQEQQEYERYKQRYQVLWQRVFDPIAVRLHMELTVRAELCVLPFANSSIYGDLANKLDQHARPLDAPDATSSTVVSVAAAAGRERIGSVLRSLPGIPEVLAADPTLTDLSWLGDRLAVHMCDDDTILEIDPSRLRAIPGLFPVSVSQQSIVALAVLAMSLPGYATIDIVDGDKAKRFLDILTSKILLKGDTIMDLPAVFDAYRLPDHKGQANYVLSYQWYALKVRLHVALIGDQLIAATEPQTLRDVIDAAGGASGDPTPPAHLQMSLNFANMERFKEDLRLYWSEKSRLACHHNIMAIYNLLKLYEVPMHDVGRLSQAKYGVIYFCPEGGAYAYDPARDQVECSLHGNRQHSRQDLGLADGASFTRFVESLQTFVTRLRFEGDSLLVTLELARRTQPAAAAR